MSRDPGRDLVASRILVVDDDVGLRMTLAANLELDGFEVVEACNGIEALALLHDSAFELVVTDIDMPRMSGVALWRALQLDAQLASVPVIFMTGSAGVSSKVELLDLGAIDYLTKPFDPDEMRARVRAVLRRDKHKVALENRILERSRALEALNDQLRREITERDAADAANRAKSQFLANMSHEIRTPLTAVLGYADLLLDRDLPATDRVKYVQTIRRNGEHLLTVLNDILDLSKIEAGKMTLEAAAASPVQIAVDVASLMRVRALEKDLDFDLHFVSPMPQTVKTDPTRVRQILMNLVGNAIKFTHRGRVTVEVGCEDATGPAPRLVFRVLDQGIGMTPEQMKSLFVPFAQADTSTTRKFGGTGLGLVICKRLADMLDGRIDVVSQPDLGSTFTLSLTVPPLDDVAMLDGMREACMLATAADALATVPRRRLYGRILLAEDGADNQLLVSTILRRAGADVKIVENGRLAVKAVLACQGTDDAFDLVLMDMQMPVLDGYGATATLRAIGFRRPIIALTAHAMASDRDRCLGAGCSDYLTKPIQRDVLIASVAHFLDANRQEHDVVEEPLVSEFSEDDDMIDLVRQFVASTGERATALLIATAAGDIQTLARLAHQLKGAAGSYGFSSITEAAAEVEAVATGDSTDSTIASALERLLRLLKRASVDDEAQGRAAA